MAADEKWYFTKAQLANTPSRKCGLDADKELSYRQQAANFIQDMGQRLKVTQLCINTAIVYMHRFYIFHSFTQFHRNSMAAASLFLAAKVEEQPRKLEHVITVAHWCLFREEPKLDTKSEQYLEQAQELVFNENVLLQTLGFDVAIDHPHTHVVRCCHLVRANKELAQTSYFMASNSLHLTTMCLQYKPTVVACFCIHLACKWSNWEIPQSSEGKDWFSYVDASVSLEQLEQLTAEFLLIFDKCPSRLKKMSGKKDDSYGLMGQMSGIQQMEQEPRKIRPTFPGSGRPGVPGQSQDGSTSSSSMQQARQGTSDDGKKPHHGPPRVDLREYKEKRAREAAAAAAAAAAGVSKDGKPPPHPQQSRQPPPHHHLAKREAVKREMMARESAKREAMKQEAAAGRRESSLQRSDVMPNQHHLSQDSRDQKRARDVLDSAAGSSGSQLHLDSMNPIQQQKRTDSHHLALDPNTSRKSREPSDIATSSSSSSHHHHHHHHPDQSRRDKERPRDMADPGASNHNNHPSINPMKRPRDSHDLSLLTHSVTQPKRPREGTDPNINALDPTKRPREPTDSSSLFASLKTEPSSQSSSSDILQHSDRHHHLDVKQSGLVSKYPQDPKSQQISSHSSFGDARQNKSMPPASMSSSQRHFSHSRHSRPQDGGSMVKNYEQEQRKLAMDKRDFPKPQQESVTLRPNQLVVGKSPVPPFSRSKSPAEVPKFSDSRSRSPMMVASSMEVEKKPTAPDVTKRMADILSRPEGHLFSPDDDREDASLPLEDILPELNPTKFENKMQRPSPSIKSKLHTTPEKSRDSLLAPPTFVLPSSPTSPMTPGKSTLPITPTSDRKRKRTQSSSSSEPELVPVVRKLDDMPEFHTIIKDNSVGIKLPGRVPDMIQPIRDHSLPSTPGKDNLLSSVKKEGLEIDMKPLISESMKLEPNKHSSGLPSLLEHPVAMPESVVKSEPAAEQSSQSIFTSVLPGVERLAEPPRVTEESSGGGGEHHHKKKKEKHNKKDKDRNRDEKKRKHKKKDREKARDEKLAEQPAQSTVPIRITIPKDKLTNLSQENKKSPKTQDGTKTLKIKIPKERLKVESPAVPSSSSTVGGLKIKIGKELMSERRLDSSPSEQVSRKRGNDTTPARQPPATAPRRNYNKQNGHQDRKVRGAYGRGRGRAPPMLPPHHPYPQQFYPYPPPMYMYPPDTQHMYGYYPPQPAMYQQQPPYHAPPPLPIGGDFQTPPPPPLPEGPPPTAPPPPPPPE